MTSRLYYTDSYNTTFDGRITELSADGQRVYLDQTAFYPTSGGQPFDVGSLGGARVADVIDEDDRVAHVLAGPLPGHAVGDTVRGEVDWPRRFDHMQQHTGQHLLSAVFADLFGYETASVHFGADRSSLDLDVGAINAARLGEAERRANEIVWENRPVSVAFEDSTTVTGLRKPPPRAGTLRVVTIEGLDRSACGGTHVRATGEIGAITLRGTERVRKQMRVEFLCGARVVRQARADFEALSAIALSVKASIAEAPGLVTAQSSSSSATPPRLASDSRVSWPCTKRVRSTTPPRRPRAACASPSCVERAARSRRFARWPWRSLHCRGRCSSRR